MLFLPLRSIRQSGHRRATHRPLVNLAEPQGADPRTASHIIPRRHADRHHQRNTAPHRYRSRQAPRLDREPFAPYAMRGWTARGEGAAAGCATPTASPPGSRIVLEHAPHTGADANISSRADLQPPHINLSPQPLKLPNARTCRHRRACASVRLRRPWSTSRICARSGFAIVPCGRLLLP